MIDRANHEFYKSFFKQTMHSKKTFKINLRFGGMPCFLKDLVLKELENIKASQIIIIIKEGTPNRVMITIIKTFKATIQARTKGMIRTDLLG